MKSMKNSGYNEHEREKILIAGIQTHVTLKEKEVKGIRPYYRSASFNHGKRKVSKANKHQWYNKGSNQEKYASVMFVDATPEDKLLKMLRETEAMHPISEDCRIKFVAKSGIKIKDIVPRKNPFKKTCGADDCIPCASSSGGKHQ